MLVFIVAHLKSRSGLKLWKPSSPGPPGRAKPPMFLRLYVPLNEALLCGTGKCDLLSGTVSCAPQSHIACSIRSPPAWVRTRGSCLRVPGLSYLFARVRGDLLSRVTNATTAFFFHFLSTKRNFFFWLGSSSLILPVKLAVEGEKKALSEHRIHPQSPFIYSRFLGVCSRNIK